MSNSAIYDQLTSRLWRKVYWKEEAQYAVDNLD